MGIRLRIRACDSVYGTDGTDTVGSYLRGAEMGVQCSKECLRSCLIKEWHGANCVCGMKLTSNGKGNEMRSERYGGDKDGD
jgi:hypothetical protein